MQISENRYKVMLNKFKEQAEKLEVLEMENEKYVNEIINQNVVIMKQSDIINATSELLTNEVKKSNDYYAKWKSSTSQFHIFMQNYEKYYDNQDLVENLNSRGQYNLNIESYRTLNQLIVDEEVPLIEDIQRLLNCVKMKWIPQVEVDVLTQEKADLNVKISQLQKEIDLLNEKFNESVIHNNKIDQDNYRLRDVLAKLEAKMKMLTTDLNWIKKEYHDSLNKIVKSQEIQWNIKTKSETPVYESCKWC